jgi:Lrp/AsnC family transcriptional regulator, leucine-responsive regulatory protein
MITLDAIDRRILERLQRDGRLSNADLAEQVGLSPSPCWRRVKALEEAGMIKGYAALLDAKSVGLSVNVFMSVSLTTQVEKALQAFEKAAAERPEVMECYLMTGDSDYLLRVVVPDLEAYERFVMDFTKIAGIAQIRSSLALRAVKQGTALPLSSANKASFLRPEPLLHSRSKTRRACLVNPLPSRLPSLAGFSPRSLLS